MTVWRVERVVDAIARTIVIAQRAAGKGHMLSHMRRLDINYRITFFISDHYFLIILWDYKFHTTIIFYAQLFCSGNACTLALYKTRQESY